MIKISIGEPKDYQGIWKDTEESPCATFHGYGFFAATNNDNPEVIESFVMHDLWHKLHIMSGESILPTEGLFNYDRFYKRFGVECLVSIFENYEEVGDFDYNDFAEYHEFASRPETKFMNFFGCGEFPFVHYGIITRENGDKFIVYFLVR
jgi:hypothetical protein